MQLGELQSLQDLDLTTVNTDYPVLQPGIYPWMIKSAEIKDTNDKKGKLLVIGLELMVDAVDKNGAAVTAGFKHTHRIGLTPTDKRTGEMIGRDVALLLDAVFGEEGRKSIKLAAFNIETLVNQQITTKTAVQPEKDGYAESTSVRFVKKEVST